MKAILKITAIILMFAGSFYSCDEKDYPNNTNAPERWVWTMEDLTVTLEFYPAENKFYTTVNGEIPLNSGIHSILFANDAWMYYKMMNDTLMYVRGETGEFPTEDARHNKWLIHRHTEDILEIEYYGTLPAIPIITRYLFNAQN
ncbi:MAG: hypothetical protein LBV41_03050 [Cytophagaceae bacterium]|jgi:hypothetical protein|nr:hypothetical protein [Cytophagaceae bacterium]